MDAREQKVEASLRGAHLSGDGLKATGMKDADLCGALGIRSKDLCPASPVFGQPTVGGASSACL